MPAKRLFAIGDIHGSDVALRTVLSKVDPLPGDTFVVLGDVVDRGPGTREAIDQLLELQSYCDVHFLMGNHEEMMLDAMSGSTVEQAWMKYGGYETLMSYGGNFDMIPSAHFDFLKSGLDYWESETAIFIHANLEPGVELSAQTPEWLRWTRLTGFEKPHPSGKQIYCGHTAQQSGLPLVADGWACLDTWVYGAGSLTCLEVETGIFMQAKQDGSYRTDLKLSD